MSYIQGRQMTTEGRQSWTIRNLRFISYSGYELGYESLSITAYLLSFNPDKSLIKNPTIC
ncbi:hypothetical protein AwDysgo_07960 [Bacteroidales bacterium]|nr:hypothetical protein AwDysgo_07960 [Bacteroidales bacterium]